MSKRASDERRAAPSSSRAPAGGGRAATGGVRSRGERINGVLLLDKPSGMTSNAALQKAQRDGLALRRDRPRLDEHPAVARVADRSLDAPPIHPNLDRDRGEDPAAP